MTNREVAYQIAHEMGGYNGETDLELAGKFLAVDLSKEGIDMNAEATVASIVFMRFLCDVPAFS